MTTFLSNRDIYESVICGIVPQARERLWIATADIKDMYVSGCGSPPLILKICMSIQAGKTWCRFWKCWLEW